MRRNAALIAEDFERIVTITDEIKENHIGLRNINMVLVASKRMNWNSLQKYKTIEFGGFTDWRLPTLDEFKVMCCYDFRKRVEDVIRNGKYESCLDSEVWSGVRYWAGSHFNYMSWSDKEYYTIIEVPASSRCFVRLVR